MTLYKVLDENRQSMNGGSATWTPGEWMPAITDLVACKRGYHLCRESDLIYWLGPAIWEAEARGAEIVQDDKIVVAEARIIRQVETWNETTARLFAADCAERVLPIFEKQYPDDKRPRLAIEAARAFARGEITAAARAAAWAAAGAAARDAAWATAGAAAWATARDAAGAAAAEIRWQTERLMQYLRGEIK